MRSDVDGSRYDRWGEHVRIDVVSDVKSSSKRGLKFMDQNM